MLHKPDIYLYECERCKHKVSRQITTHALLSMFEMAEGLHTAHIRPTVFIVLGILVLYDTKNIQVLCWTFWHLIFLNLSYIDKILAWE